MNKFLNFRERYVNIENGSMVLLTGSATNWDNNEEIVFFAEVKTGAMYYLPIESFVETFAIATRVLI